MPHVSLKVSIHNETQTWILVCDMRLQRGRSGLSSTVLFASPAPKVGSCIDIIAARVPELPNAVPISAQLLMGLGYHGVASGHRFFWTADNNVSIHNDTRMWNLPCDMRLQRAGVV